MTTFPLVTDLKKLEQALGANPKYRRLGTTIQKALVAQSCAADLKQVIAIIDAESKTVSLGEELDAIRVTVEASLLLSAITLYARATWSKSDRRKRDRGSLGIEHRFTPEEKAVHESLGRLRDEVYAHVQTNKVIADDIWHSDWMIAVQVSNGWSVGGVKRTTSQNKVLWAVLARHVPVAFNLVMTTMNERINEVAQMLSGLPLQLLERHTLDPVELFGSEDAARRLLPGGDGIAYVSRNTPNTP